ncbi:MAG: hypothetical protein PHV34_22865, partial [Verrucomicrobiae bacterium]|nr:hypothetical protein [Verrucomicrobiae bacterium]
MPSFYHPTSPDTIPFCLQHHFVKPLPEAPIIKGAWQFRRVFWVGFSLEGQEILDLGLRWLAEHLRGGFIFPLD